MNIFKEAKQRKLMQMGYRARRFKILWKSKTVSWNYISIEWGIRWSDLWQLFPVWNMSDNCKKSLMFGIWKLYFEISYYRKRSFNQDRMLPMSRKLRRFYRLIS